VHAVADSQPYWDLAMTSPFGDSDSATGPPIKTRRPYDDFARAESLW
jgi:hypothetical protein